MEIYVCVVIILLIYGYISYKLLCDIVNLKKSIIQVKKISFFEVFISKIKEK